MRWYSQGVSHSEEVAKLLEQAVELESNTHTSLLPVSMASLMSCAGVPTWTLMM